jgi:ectoine hydroxylase-related dioxygenase (phytanoyl-CoA dioxygenase family)
MHITTEQLKFYEDNGYLLMPECFSQAEVGVLKAQLPGVFADETPRKVVEKEGGVVRSVYGTHQRNEIFRRLSMHPRLVEPAMQILGSQVYVYQFKINAKVAFDGDVWDWHQDYIFWQKEDGMKSARVTNAIIFLDEVTEFNGPLFFISGSHKDGVIDVPARDKSNPVETEKPSAYRDSPDWISNLTADLRYSLDREIIVKLVERHGLVAPKGPSGSVLFFDSNLVHGSPNNISPFDRVVVLISFNSIENVPAFGAHPRPDFLVSHEAEAIVPVADNALLSSERTATEAQRHE